MGRAKWKRALWGGAKWREPSGREGIEKAQRTWKITNASTELQPKGSGHSSFPPSPFPLPQIYLSFPILPFNRAFFSRVNLGQATIAVEKALHIIKKKAMGIRVA